MEILHEEWRPVVGHEEKYEVSSLGRVRSLDCMVVRRGVRPVFRKGIILKPGLSSALGYPLVNIKARSKYVHRLVLEAFVGPCPEGSEACHGNGIRTDSRLANLRWDTPHANQMDRVAHGTSNRGERCGSAKLTQSQAREILASTERNTELARRYGVAQQTICNIRKGRRWAHLNQ